MPAKFVFDVLASGASKDVFALTSASAATVLERLSVLADLVHVDAGQDQDATLSNHIRYGRSSVRVTCCSEASTTRADQASLSAVDVRRSGSFGVELVDARWCGVRRQVE